MEGFRTQAKTSGAEEKQKKTNVLLNFIIPEGILAFVSCTKQTRNSVESAVFVLRCAAIQPSCGRRIASLVSAGLS